MSTQARESLENEAALIAAWERSLPWLTPDSDADALAQARAALLRGECQIWPGERSVILTCCARMPDGDKLQIVGMGGDYGELMAMQVGVFAWARSHGCAEAFAKKPNKGRWATALRLFGFSDLDGELRKSLRLPATEATRRSVA